MNAVRSLGKQLVSRFPAVARPIWRVAYPLFRKDQSYAGAEYSDRASAFEKIYRDNRWQNAESVSGPGSTLEATSMLQSAIDKAVKRTGARVLLDAPCGDFNWMQHIRLPAGTRYIGGDIVADLASDLQKRFSRAHRSFRHLDIAADQLPAADLWLCRHVLFHLSNEDVRSVLRNFAQSNVGYLLADSFDFPRENENIRSGGFRFINLRIAPFSLPKPLATYANSNPPQPPDYLNLWSREQVQSAIVTW